MTRRDCLSLFAAAQLPAQPPISSITPAQFWSNLDGRSATWFHSRVARIPGSQSLLMTLQTITGSDVFGPVHQSYSTDLGHTWSDPQPIPGMGRRQHPDTIQEGYCDTVPEPHAPSGTVLAIAQNVYYLNEKLTRPNDHRYPFYIVRRADGSWSPLRRIEWEHPEATATYMSGASQRVTLPNGDIFLPISCGPLDRTDRSVCTTLASFDGDQFRIRAHGNFLRLSAGRGLLEPTMVSFGSRYLLSIRAENQQGFVAASKDGLEWDTLRPWCWEDGEPLIMSTTQQRWLAHGGALYLVYTRKHPSNVDVMRWRAPLFLAEVDPKRLCLIRATERIVMPLYGDGIHRGNEVEHLGNFHVTHISPDESLITTGTVIPANFRGAIRFSRLRWSRPDSLD